MTYLVSLWLEGKEATQSARRGEAKVSFPLWASTVPATPAWAHTAPIANPVG